MEQPQMCSIPRQNKLFYWQGEKPPNMDIQEILGPAAQQTSSPKHTRHSKSKDHPPYLNGQGGFGLEENKLSWWLAGD